MLNTKQAKASRLQFMHCNIENTEAQTLISKTFQTSPELSDIHSTNEPAAISVFSADCNNLFTEEPPCAATSHKHPPPISDLLSKTPNSPQSKPYSWNPT